MREGFVKKIIVDLDDTICSTFNRDFENSVPNIRLINKINNFFYQDWEIVILTARGNLSCKDLEEREQKYRKQIEVWLKKNGVKYTRLSFEKELAVHYIDDKSIRPDEFCELEIENLIGWSGATIEKHGEKVLKTHEKIHSEVSWYHLAKNFDFNVPKISSVVGKTLEMEYIHGKTGDVSSKELFEICEKFKLIKHSSPDFETYLEYISKHCTLDVFTEFVEKLKKDSHTFFNSQKSFCHGDLSLENIIKSEINYKLYLIDPIYLPAVYSSWLLDISKSLYSLKFLGQAEKYEELLELSPNKLDVLKLEATHWMRVYKYAPTETKSRILEEFRQCLTK